MTIEGYRAGLHAWIRDTSSEQFCLARDGMELKEKGTTFKAVGIAKYGRDADDPSNIVLEFKESKRLPENQGYDFDNPDSKFTLKNEEIDALRLFLSERFGEFDADAYYVRVGSPQMADLLKTKMSTIGGEQLAGLLSAVDSQEDLAAAVEAAGHGDFLASYVMYRKNSAALDELEAAIADPTSTESVFQKILERNPWLFGGQYVDVHDRRELAVGDQHDIPLLALDGSLHLVELKRAAIERLVKPHRNHLMMGNDVHEAVSQTQNYLRTLDEEAHTIKSKFGVEAHRVFSTVVIGSAQHNKATVSPDDLARTMRVYNSHLTRIQVITYDQLLANARSAIERHREASTPTPAVE
ncbi:hypothetical protein AXK57_14225 [Tsukamurella pulmonis]|nr:hypothetical protein AXK57_14225 [Tsukamurella pulmonis]RDH10454.1 DUF4263 domain-containing protein [Tsukamurella pulmonis]